MGKEVEQTLLAYEWPGNVRELRGVIERAVILCDTDEITLNHLPLEMRSLDIMKKAMSHETGTYPSLVEMEKIYISHVLQSVENNISEASRVLGISRNTLKAKLHKTDGQS